ncbi:MAG: adenylyl-sulfate kinase [Chitinophagales bacterium]|nr:adenylyl-sulfate kinase [Chitinophagales bacterium]|tara:strand:- start:628 stop:1227 length:600 start_codon:yes stop_codon:yes gene_type:complete
MSNNIHPIFDQLVSREEKESFLNQHSKLIWLTGLSGSGKSTIAKGLEKALFKRGFYVQVLDGDNIRTGICNNLGFTVEDRSENIRRISEVAKLFIEAGVVTICSFVSPTQQIRKIAQQIIGDNDHVGVFIDAPIEICEKRDVKGLYKKARAGEIKNFTGIDSPFERPDDPNLIIETAEQTIEESVEQVLQFVLPLISKK